MDLDIGISLPCQDVSLLQILSNIPQILIYLKKNNTDLTLHYSNLEAVIVPVVGDPVMDLGRSPSLLAFLLFIILVRAAGAASARIL